MSTKIGILNASFSRMTTDDSGELELSFKVKPESRTAARQIAAQARQLMNDGKDKLVLSLSEYRNKRSLAQNNLMWALLEIMADHMNAGRTGGVTAWDCYIDMIERYGGKFEYLECTKEAFEFLKERFRALKVIEERKGGKTVMCKAFIGSSQFNTQEMNQLIDGIYDELEKIGADTLEARYLYEEYQR